MTATEYMAAVTQFNKANEAWQKFTHDKQGDEKAILDAFIAAAAKCIGTCPITSDRLWYEEKHMMAVDRRSKVT